MSARSRAFPSAGELVYVRRRMECFLATGNHKIDVGVFDPLIALDVEIGRHLSWLTALHANGEIFIYSYHLRNYC